MPPPMPLQIAHRLFKAMLFIGPVASRSCRKGFIDGYALYKLKQNRTTLNQDITELLQHNLGYALTRQQINHHRLTICADANRLSDAVDCLPINDDPPLRKKILDIEAKREYTFKHTPTTIGDKQIPLPILNLIYNRPLTCDYHATLLILKHISDLGYSRQVIARASWNLNLFDQEYFHRLNRESPNLNTTTKQDLHKMHMKPLQEICDTIRARAKEKTEHRPNEQVTTAINDFLELIPHF